MKDSSRADARVYRYHRAPRPREFISGPPRFASPTARNLSSCEITATRKSSSIISHGDIHHQMVITGGSRVIPDLFADPVITTRNVTRRGSFIPPLPLPTKGGGKFIGIDFYDSEFIGADFHHDPEFIGVDFQEGGEGEVKIYRHRCEIQSICLSIPGEKNSRVSSGRENLITRNLSITGEAPSIRDFVSIFIATRFIASPFSRFAPRNPSLIDLCEQRIRSFLFFFFE